LFPHSSRFSTLELATNPIQFAVNDVTFLGNSGQPVKDIVRQSMKPTAQKNIADVTAAMDLQPPLDNFGSSTTTTISALDALENTVLWGHVAPTCPGWRGVDVGIFRSKLCCIYF
jgi:DNA polymerase II small subunit/DNA polymerase delta subunit B